MDIISTSKQKKQQAASQSSWMYDTVVGCYIQTEISESTIWRHLSDTMQMSDLHERHIKSPFLKYTIKEKALPTGRQICYKHKKTL